ncbi:MAG: DNA repair exonuclease [Armatimonadetes bacterium]|nr:DNA repair exonuclease [Armatimonadota bacterium]
MRIAHLADVHLGYRAYTRTTSAGLNRREVDVFKAFQSVLQRVIDLNPDIVIIAGDLFHSVRPSNYTINNAYRLLRDFRNQTPAPLVIIGGNHDTPKSVDTGCILDLFDSIPNVFIRHHGYHAVAFPELDCAVYCLPYFALEDRAQYLLRPEAGPSTNILTVHGTVQGVVRSRDSEALQAHPSEFHFEEWNYAAFGHYHIRCELEPNAYYAGSIEYTSTNIWEECPGARGRPSPKGFVLYDTDAGKADFFETPDLRYVRDLGVLNAESLSAAEVMEGIDARLASVPGGLNEKILRIVVEAFPRALQKELDWQRLRSLKNDALHLDVVFRPQPETHRALGRTPGGGARPLELEWEDYAGGMEDVPRGIERSRLVELGNTFLRQAAEAEVGL